MAGGGRDWPVDLWTLRRLVINFQRARDRGVRIPVVWNHSEDARDKIGEVVRLYLAGQTLRARFWATATSDADRMEESASQVSVEVVEDWVDGKGRQYDLFLSHLAIVTHPVVHPQGPVYRLGMQGSNQNQQGANSMSEERASADAAVAEEPVAEMEAMVRGIVGLINQIVDSLGASFDWKTIRRRRLSSSVCKRCEIKSRRWRRAVMMVRMHRLPRDCRLKIIVARNLSRAGLID